MVWQQYFDGASPYPYSPYQTPLMSPHYTPMPSPGVGYAGMSSSFAQGGSGMESFAHTTTSPYATGYSAMPSPYNAYAQMPTSVPITPASGGFAYQGPPTGASEHFIYPGSARASSQPAVYVYNNNSQDLPPHTGRSGGFPTTPAMGAFPGSAPVSIPATPVVMAHASTPVYGGPPPRIPVHDAELTDEVRDMRRDVRDMYNNNQAHDCAKSHRPHHSQYVHAPAYHSHTTTNDTQMKSLQYHYWKSIDEANSTAVERQREEEKKLHIQEHESKQRTKESERDALYREYQLRETEKKSILEGEIVKAKSANEEAEKRKKADFEQYLRDKEETVRQENERIKQARLAFEADMKRDQETKQSEKTNIITAAKAAEEAANKAASEKEADIRRKFEMDQQNRLKAQAETTKNMRLQLEKEMAETKAKKEAAEAEALARVAEKRKEQLQLRQEVLDAQKREADAEAKKEADIVRRAEERKKTQEAQEIEIYERRKRLLETQAKNKEEQEKVVVLKHQQLEVDKKKKQIELEKAIIQQVQEREAGEKKKKMEEEQKLASEMTARLARFGFQENQIAAFIDPTKEPPPVKPAALLQPGDAPSIPLHPPHQPVIVPPPQPVVAVPPPQPIISLPPPQPIISAPPPQQFFPGPTYSSAAMTQTTIQQYPQPVRVLLEDIAPETLSYYSVPWEYDQHNPEYAVIHTDVTQTDIDYMYEHSRSRKRHSRPVIYEHHQHHINSPYAGTPYMGGASPHIVHSSPPMHYHRPASCGPYDVPHGAEYITEELDIPRRGQRPRKGDQYVMVRRRSSRKRGLFG